MKAKYFYTHKTHIFRNMHEHTHTFGFIPTTLSHTNPDIALVKSFPVKPGGGKTLKDPTYYERGKHNT